MIRNSKDLSYDVKLLSPHELRAYKYFLRAKDTSVAWLPHYHYMIQLEVLDMGGLYPFIDETVKVHS